MPFDIDAAIKHAHDNAKPPFGIQKCAQYTREAIEAGGVIVANTRSAKDYGPYLWNAGFVPVTTPTPVPTEVLRRGDVVVIEGFPEHPHGHMAIYDGENWVSDFVQRELYPGPRYRNSKPRYQIFRHASQI